MDANSISVNCLLENYKAIYGEIVFPDKLGEGQAKKRRDIYANPAGWMYSFDGLRWQTAPMDIGKIDYPRAMFRKIPAGIIVGVNDTVKKPRKTTTSARTTVIPGAVCTIQKTLPVIIGFTMAGMNGFGSSAEAKQAGYERQK